MGVCVFDMERNRIMPELEEKTVPIKEINFQVKEFKEVNKNLYHYNSMY